MSSKKSDLFGCDLVSIFRINEDSTERKFISLSQHAGVEKESPSTLCLARIEGLERLPLTTAEDHSGQRQEAYGNIATFVSTR